MIGIVDYGMGNRRSVEKAFAHVGADVRVTADHGELREASRLVLVGVGAFPEGMRRLRAGGFDELLHERVGAGVPLLGLCLGMQLLFEASEEHEGATGLGFLRGTVTRIQGAAKLPHIGWNLVTWRRPSPLNEGLGEAAAFYHVHTFVPRCEDPEDVVGTSEYGEVFASVVERGVVGGTQFHPEKSSVAGLRLLANFAQTAAVPA